ncbi:MAG: helix-turn-helix domain-containing protein [Acidimicrobiales bacterium]
MTERRLTLTVSEAAETLGIGRTLAYRLIRSGELRSVKVGGRRFITENQLQSYVADLEDSN